MGSAWELPAEVHAKLEDPATALLAYGKVHDAKLSVEYPYDPTRLTYHLQATILAYVSSPPLTQYNQTTWLAVLGPRQAGKSTAAELAGLPKAMYNPGWDHVCIADTRRRADYLHGRVQYAFHRWPMDLRPPKATGKTESRQLSFDDRYGGKMRVLTAEAGAVGIGQSPDFYHASEVAFWTDAAGQFTLVNPSMINKDRCLALYECTPAPMGFPSTEWWRDTCQMAKHGEGRWIYAFFPFWDVKTCARPWPKGAALDNEEIELLNKYGSKVEGGYGLKKENLAFRRLIMETDKEIRRNPALFGTYYPFDDVSCWLQAALGVIPRDVLAHFTKRVLVPWAPEDDFYHEYEPPEAGALYCIGGDPTGYGVRHHASFEVLKLWADEWVQVAEWSGPVGDPWLFAQALMRVGLRYNQAWIGVERNGVGVATLEHLRREGYPRIYHENQKPGIVSAPSKNDAMLADLIEALKDEFRQGAIRSEKLVDQMLTYRNDKKLEDQPRSEMLYGVNKKKREKHHWDRVSALIMAVQLARKLPRRHKPVRDDEMVNVVPFRSMTYDDIERYRKQSAKPDGDSSRGRRMRPRIRRK